jgi:hypothetical protein
VIIGTTLAPGWRTHQAHRRTAHDAAAGPPSAGNPVRSRSKPTLRRIQRDLWLYVDSVVFRQFTFLLDTIFVHFFHDP